MIDWNQEEEQKRDDENDDEERNKNRFVAGRLVTAMHGDQEQKRAL